jgi:ADP-heptose:LPS heptosyltransferase
LEPLFDLPGAAFVSLQVGPPAAELTALEPRIPVRDLTGHLRDFSDTAAMISQLDLVISVDTSVAHLAGALGKTVWTLLCYQPDWRWRRHGTDSPWYPTMRLFRQPAKGNWKGVIADVRQALVQWLGGEEPS